MTDRSVTHATFTLERVYDASPERVFTAFTDPAEKAAWFHGPEEVTVDRQAFDLRTGGHERVVSIPKEGPKFTFDATYHEVVPDERLVSTYDMYMDDTRLSVSLATVEFTAEGSGTRLTYTEHGAFLDGHEDPALREHGTGELLDQLGAHLAKG